MPNDLQTILLEDHSYIQINSKKAAAATTPGMILERDSNDEFKPHATAEDPWGGYVACEDELQGKTISDEYSIDDIIRVAIVRRGDRVNMLLQDDENVSIGDKLVSNGDGTVRKLSGDSSAMEIPGGGLIGEADEALDLSGSSAVESSAMWGDQRLAVRIW